MPDSPDRIVINARTGLGPCAGCRTHTDTGGQFVSPGLINYDANLIILTMDPSHSIDWDQYTDWTEYNATVAEQFKHDWRGGTAIQTLLAGIPGITIDDIWLGDAVKCPVKNDNVGNLGRQVPAGSAVTTPPRWLNPGQVRIKVDSDRKRIGKVR